MFLDQELWHKQPDVDRWWETLFEVFASKESDGSAQMQRVLILHMPRHYALIFGLRELPAGEAKEGKKRQILTARRKQKPKEWLDFDIVLQEIGVYDEDHHRSSRSRYNVLQIRRLE